MRIGGQSSYANCADKREWMRPSHIAGVAESHHRGVPLVPGQCLCSWWLKDGSQMSCDEPESEVLQTDFWSVLCSVPAPKYPFVLPEALSWATPVQSNMFRHV